jgi:hypothetical protein
MLAWLVPEILCGEPTQARKGFFLGRQRPPEQGLSPLQAQQVNSVRQ